MEETAHQMKFSYIGTEHLLYGMLSCPWVTAWKILAENGTDYVKLRELSEKKDEAEEQLMEKMERWEYLEELAEKIANQ